MVSMVFHGGADIIIKISLAEIVEIKCIGAPTTIKTFFQKAFSYYFLLFLSNIVPKKHCVLFDDKSPFLLLLFLHFMGVGKIFSSKAA